jgi:hypothetical protein
MLLETLFAGDNPIPIFILTENMDDNIFENTANVLYDFQ